MRPRWRPRSARCEASGCPCASCPRRLPAVSSLPGHIPAQLAAWRRCREAAHVGADLGQHHLGGDRGRRPGSSAAARAHARKGAGAPRSRPTAGRSSRPGSRCGQQVQPSSACGARKRPSSAWRSAGSFARSCPWRAAASASGSLFPAQSSASIARPEAPSTSVATLGELDVGVLQHLLDAVGHARPLPDERLAVAGQVAQLADRLGRHEAGPQQAVLEQLAIHWRVLDVGLAAGHVLDVLGVDQQQLEAALQQVEDRLPVDAGRLHRDVGDAGPGASRAGRAGRRSWWRMVRCSARLPSRPGTWTQATTVLVDVERAAALEDAFHHCLPRID